MEGGLGWKGGKEAVDRGRVELEVSSVKLFCFVNRSCEAGNKCLVIFSVVSCEQSEHS